MDFLTRKKIRNGIGPFYLPRLGLLDCLRREPVPRVLELCVAASVIHAVACLAEVAEVEEPAENL